MNPTVARPRRQRSSAKLSRYLISEMLLPSLLALVAFGLVVLLTDLLGYADLIVNRGLGVKEVGQIATLQLIPTLARTLPFAVLIGALIGLGRLSADRELLALETAGFSARQLARPGLFFAFVAALFSIALSVVFSPASQRAVRDKMIELSEDKPGLALRAGMATNLGGWRMEAREVEGEGARLAGVLLYMPTLGETVFSQHGAIMTDDLTGDGTQLRKRLVLEDGLVLSNGTDRASLLRFDRMETELPAFESDSDVPVDRLTTLPFGELLAEAIILEDPAAARFALIEAHRRVALGAAALPFGLLAMGLALGRRNLSRSGGTVIGLIGAIAYYALVQFSESMLWNPNVPVAPVVWFPDLVLVTVATVLIFRAGESASESDRSSSRNSKSLLERTGIGRNKLRMKRSALPRYVSAQFIRMVTACIVGLFFAYLVIDVFDNLKYFNLYGATFEEIARFYGARIPILISRVIPMALLIAVALTISLLGANGELLGMRACGIPVFRVLAPIWLLCGLAVPAYHLLANEIVPHSSERAKRLKDTEIKNRPTGPQLQRERVWYRVGPRVYEMGRLDLLDGIADSVTLYDLGDDGLPRRRTDAEGARNVGRRGLWLLENPRSIELNAAGRLERPSDIRRLAEFGEETPSEIETAHMTPGDLRLALEDPNLEPPLTSAYRTGLQMKIAAPLACLLLPLIALFFAATGPPFPRPVHTLIACAVVAVTHALATSFAGSMGYGGTLDPLLAGWGPSILFGLVAAGMGFRLRRKLSRSG
ncbi:MAG: YjgP/YjgQ family permease [bacterium]|nr:YjgP/YjgQ family permease [bacterium]